MRRDLTELALTRQDRIYKHALVIPKLNPETQLPVFSDKTINTTKLAFSNLIRERQSATMKFECFVFSANGSARAITFEKQLELRRSNEIHSFSELILFGAGE